MPRTADLEKIRALLASDPAWSVYALGDLAPAHVGRCEWYVPRGDAAAVVMVYRGFQRPVLFALGEPEHVDGLLDEATWAREIYLHVRPEIVPAVRGRYRECEAWPMWRMALGPDTRLDGPPAGAVRLGLPDLPALQRLYADGQPTGEGPAFFDAEMLASGVFFGVYADQELMAAGGTHLVAPSEGVAAVGAIYTRRERRCRGLATAVTGAITAELQRMHVSTIALNVDQRNGAAIRIYERLGYVRHCEYWEGVARR